jgi:Type III restriction enzyme, res subunit
MKINFCSAPCGSGKTRQLIESACRLANKGENVLFLQPTKELIDKTIELELQGRSAPPPHQKFYGAPKGHSVARELMEYFHCPMGCGHIVFATHQVLPFVRFWENQGRLHVFVDEELQVSKQGYFKVPRTHQLITDYIDLLAYDAIYSRVVVTNDGVMSEIARNEHHDEIRERFRETAQILINPRWESFVNTEQFHKLMTGTAKTLSIHSILKPDTLGGFASVTMASANFEDTLIYKMWAAAGVKFEENLALKQSLRFQEHQNGDLISIKYLTDLAWSKKLQGKLSSSNDPDSQTFLQTMVEAVKSEFQDQAIPLATQ